MTDSLSIEFAITGDGCARVIVSGMCILAQGETFKRVRSLWEVNSLGKLIEKIEFFDADFQCHRRPGPVLSEFPGIAPVFN